MSKKFSGVYTALVTPFIDNKVDFASIEKLVEFQLKQGVDGFVVNGTTAESPCLEWDEVKEIYNLTRKISGSHFPIILGSGSNSTNKTIETSKKCEQLGADGVLVVCPYYNKPTQEGMTLHFNQVANSVRIPLILYNVPGRTVVGLESNTILELSKNKNIIGVKEATGNMGFAKELFSRIDKDFIFLSGDDDSCVEFAALGGDGVISVISHIIPKQLKEYYAHKNLDLKLAGEYRETFKELLKTIYSESNPIGIKMALYMMGIIASPELRLPMTKMTEPNAVLLKNELENLELLN